MFFQDQILLLAQDIQRLAGTHIIYVRCGCGCDCGCRVFCVVKSHVAVYVTRFNHVCRGLPRELARLNLVGKESVQIVFVLPQ
jgi:hypothetical protein